MHAHDGLCMMLLMVLNTDMADGAAFYLVEEACTRLRVSPWTVYRRIADGTLRAARPANRWLIAREDVERLLAPLT
jgi:excisionase family DNA binding protein